MKFGIKVFASIVRFFPAVFICMLMTASIPVLSMAANFSIGSGIYDITGPAAELGMMGFHAGSENREHQYAVALAVFCGP